ncbi:MAG: glycosyltransferase family 2 protein [Clostridiaceae bacterium]
MKLEKIKPNCGRLNNNFYNPTILDNLDLSIVIPAYNVSNYIDACITSILSQVTKYKYNIIIINDGSQDDTEQKLQKYKNRDNILIINQTNNGQAFARNRALEYCDGKYLMFVDADDILLQGTIEKLLNIANGNDYDIIEGVIISFHNQEAILDDAKKLTKKIRVFEYSKNPYHVLSSKGYSPGKIFKRELWNQIRYPEGYIFEDTIIKLVVRRYCKRCAFYDDYVYGYRYNVNSTTRSGNAIRALDALWVLPKVIEISKELNISTDKIFYLLILNHLGILMRNIVYNLDTIIQKYVLVISSEIIKEYYLDNSRRLPFLFKLLEKSIITLNFDNWILVSDFLGRYNVLKKWRESN